MLHPRFACPSTDGPPTQVLKATTALTRHLEAQRAKHQSASKTRNLLAASDADPASSALSTSSPPTDPEPIWLQLTTKTHIVDQKRLKPGKIPLPHPLHRRPDAAVLLIVPDPQRTYKDVLSHPAFPRPLAAQVRPLGVSKLKARYKSFESRRQLLAQYDVFLADDRVVPLLPKLLGKIVYETPKRPVPVSLEGYRPRDKDGKTVKRPKGGNGPGAEVGPSRAVVLPPEKVAQELARALASAQVHLSPSTSTSVKVGFADFAPQELADNVAAVVDGLVAKFVTKGWRNVRAVHVKGPSSAALPVWTAPELWLDEQQVLADGEVEKMRALEAAKREDRKRKRKGEGSRRAQPPKKAPRLSSEGFSKEMVERRERLRAQKKEAVEQIEAAAGAGDKVRAVEQPASVDVGEGSKGQKVKKSEAVTASA